MTTGLNALSRAEQVLADFCNEHKVSGLTSWDPSDMGLPARMITDNMNTLLLVYGPGLTRSQVANELELSVRDRWGIPERWTRAAISEVIDELGPDLLFL